MTNKHTRRGFTLIELLVVVLIIGILAAVALPQYQFAVDKSRVTPMVANIQSIIRAEQVYKVANGDYTPNLSALDIDTTKICPAVNANSNELKGCQGGFGINLPSYDGVSFPSSASTYINLLYCQDPSVECSSDIGSYHLSAGFSVEDGSVKFCAGYTTRGQKLCKWLKPQ